MAEKTFSVQIHGRYVVDDVEDKDEAATEIENALQSDGVEFGMNIKEIEKLQG